MTQALPLEDRVAKLELEMAEVRYVTSKADKDVADFKTVLIGHTGVINAIRDDQVEHGKRLARLEAEVRSGFANVDANFAKVDTNFGKIEEKFELLSKGQEAITQLLSRHLGEPDEETHAGE